MKMKIMLLAIALTASASATVSIQGSYGDLRTSTGNLVANNTLYILVGSSTGTFAGNFTINTTLGAVGANSVFTSGQTITLGSTLATGNTIFHIGGTGGALAEAVLSGLSNTGDVASGNNYAIYWFPGSTFGGGNSGSVASQVGGYNNTVGESAFEFGGMVIPANGADVTQGFATVSGGGSLANSIPTAVNLIPEPSAALLGALGVLGLLRRRRN